ncbi:hemoglobin/transferrin/lactoferrin receptor protein [Parvibaculum indicum]|uniref:TonB-dependent receptor n=1 Tax=Parvibaculum indicum TaxID=562969 RepID=UPI0014230C21|nr:TonB-dependent receptor [Parvibaculum indicum]NIJ40669.1 hemoglobin/transferrin/lactoferrin receptor protein [Parvibaculum indicum]
MSGTETGRRCLAAYLMGGTALALSALFVSSPASAQEVPAASEVRRYAFDIDAKPLAEAIADVGAVSGWRIAYSFELPENTVSGGLRGNFTVEEAMRRLLSGTGVTYRVSGAQSIVLDRMPVADDDALMLDAIDITAVPVQNPADLNYESSSSVVYIPQEEIQRFRGTSVGDFLKGQPGVMTGDNRNSGAIDINIRGMQGQGRVPVVIDGSVQQNTVYRGYSGVASRNYIDPDLIGGVVIEKGPSSGVYGTGATGGVAVMRTLRADDIVKSGNSWGARIRGGLMGNTSEPPPPYTTGGYYGSGSYPYGGLPSDLGAPTGMNRPAFLEPTAGFGSAAIAYKSDRIDLLGAYVRRKQGNYHAGTKGDTPTPIIRDTGSGYTVGFEGLNRFRAGEEVLNTSMENTSYLIKGEFRPWADQSLTLSYRRYESEFGELMPSVIIRGEGALQAPLSEVTVDTYTANYNWNPADSDLFDLTAEVWRTRTETQIRTPYRFFGFDFGQGYWDVAKRWGGTIYNRTKLDTGVGDFTFDYGGSYTAGTIEPPEDVASKDPGAGGILEARYARREEGSAFLSGEWKPFDWLKLESAVRYTAAHSRDNRPSSGGVVHNEQTNAGFAPIYAITVEPLDGFQVYGRYAEAIRLPSIFETSGGWSQTPDPDLDLKAERAQDWEFGVNYLKNGAFLQGDALRGKFAYFNNYVKDYLTRSINTWGGFGGARIRNMEHAWFEGFEAELNYDAGVVFTGMSATLHTYAEFCRQKEECWSGGVKNGYAQMHLPPEWTADATLGTRLFDETLTLGGRVTYVGDRPASSSNRDSGGYTTLAIWDHYTLVDFFATYEVNENLSLDVNVDNVLDAYYMDALNTGLMPSPGRTFRASFTYNF